MNRSLVTLIAIGLTSSLSSASKTTTINKAKCFPESCSQGSNPTTAFEETITNSPLHPKTCDSDISISIAGLYWKSSQDGMEYAVENQITNPNLNPVSSDIEELNQLINSEYENPSFKWNAGFKICLGYSGCHDGWDIGARWTWYQGKAYGHIEVDKGDNRSLLPLCSAFAPAQGNVLYATDINHHWKLQLNLVDIELGREFWTSKHLLFRPSIGLRIASIDQNYTLEHKGGSWSLLDISKGPKQPALNNLALFKNDFLGVGIRSGLDTVWNVGCGLAAYGNFAASIVSGRFYLKDYETNKRVFAPSSKTKVLEIEESFRASRAILDCGLGVQWSKAFCDCCYFLTLQLGWEGHLFFHQNQMKRVQRIGAQETLLALPNNTGENLFQESWGSLDTQGLTLTLKFEF